MGSYQTVAATEEQYKLIVSTLRKGFTHNGIVHKSNTKVAFAVILEANLGVRISDIVKLRLEDIVRNGSTYQLNIIEQKTGKERNYIVPDQLYNYIKEYCMENNIGDHARIINITERAVQMLVKECVSFLGLENISTHSFRKMSAINMYENSGHDVALVQQFLQHASSSTTMVYIKKSSAQMDNAISKSLMLV